LQFGALPAHAQTSIPIVSLLCGLQPTITVVTTSYSNTATATISPAIANIPINYSITTTGGTLTTPASASGQLLTNALGQVSLPFTVGSLPAGVNSATVTFTVASNPVTGARTCSTVYAWDVLQTYTLVCRADEPPFTINIPQTSSVTLEPLVTISPAAANIPMNYVLTFSGGTLTQPASTTGQVLTNGAGEASFLATVGSLVAGSGNITVTWSFANPSQGTGTCTNSAQWTATQTYVFNCPTSQVSVGVDEGEVSFTSTISISPAATGISVSYTVQTTNGTINAPSPSAGSLVTDGTGSVNLPVSISGAGDNGTATVTWFFTNIANGADICAIDYEWALFS
jgi:hypothetical protein